jgi:hypothetical protein
VMIFISGCKPYYFAADFDKRTAEHKIIAVLPFEMVFSGVKPERLTEEELKTIQDAESRAFMISFYNEILRSTKSGKKPIRVDIQHYDKTLSILKENGIDARTSWKEDPATLAKMLGVDAVVKARVEKYRLMSDLASYGIDIGTHIIGVLSDYRFWFWMPPGITKAKEINANFSLLDANSTALWSIAFEKEADWREPANKIIDHINRKAAKTFPYRKSKEQKNTSTVTVDVRSR